MKRIILVSVLCLIALTLAACGGNEGAKSGASAEAAQQAGAGQAEAAAAVTALPSDEGAASTVLPSNEEAATTAASQAGSYESTAADGASLAAAAAQQERPVDLDLTKISGTVVYSQVYDMIMEPSAYMGKKIKMKGSFSYYKDPETQQEYFAAIIADATACCSQGIEFTWKGEHSYPRDYPPLDTQITVTGTFNTYYEGEYMYVQLTDADVSW